MDFSEGFPLTMPNINFLGEVQHPLIDTKGKLDCEKLIPDWKYGKHMLLNVFS